MEDKSSHFMIRLEAFPGMGLNGYAREACRIADRVGCSVIFEANEMELIAPPDYNPELLLEIWKRQIHLANNRTPPASHDD